MQNLNNIKIIFCDIDGTLVDDTKNFSDHTKESIKKVIEKGILFVLVSGRDYFHVMKRVTDLESSKILISSNGAFIYDMEKSVAIYADRINPEKVKKTVKYCDDNENSIILRTLSGRYYNKYLKTSDELIDKYIAIHDNTNFDNIFVSQMIVFGDTIEKIEAAKDYLQSLDLEITNYSTSFFYKDSVEQYYFDVNNKNISKGYAITYLLEKLNIEKEDSLCFGDFINDIDMFDACGIKVAMGNAHHILKEKADFITDTNNDDGVANFLDKYF